LSFSSTASRACVAARAGSGIGAVEQNAHLATDLVKEAFQVETVAAVGQLDEPRGQAGEFLEPLRLVALRDAGQHEFAGFHHFQCSKPVEEGEDGLRQVTAHGFNLRLARRATVVDSVHDALADELFP
jgi:hypothetical protein